MLSYLGVAVARIKQACVGKKVLCVVPRNRFVTEMLSVMKDLGFVRGFAVSNRTVVVFLRYKRGKTGLRSLCLFSRSSNRIFLKRSQIGGKNILGYYKNSGTLLFSTSLSTRFLTAAECYILGVGGQPVVSVS